LASDDLLSQLKDPQLLSASEPEFRTAMVNAFKRSLKNDPAYNEKSKLWEWLNNGPIAQVARFFCEIVSRLKDINLYVVEHSPIISYCTGSHNNVVNLGSSEQAKGAMFYITPYLTKNKIALEHCLTVLQKVREHVNLYPSKAANTGTEIRTVQHVLTRTLNKLNCLMEISDYQAAASLLALPSEITSDTFAYVSPNACMVYETFSRIKNDNLNFLDNVMRELNRRQDEQELQLEREGVAISGIQSNVNDAFIVLDDVDDGIDNDVDDISNYVDDHAADEDDCTQFVAPAPAVMDTAQTGDAIPKTPYNWDDILEGLGKVPLYTIEIVNDKKIKQRVPVQAHYPHRGQGLRFMS
jgi:hypothetical protein